MTTELKKIRLQLARTQESPDRSPCRGCELVAPLSQDSHLDSQAWPARRRISD